MAPPESIAFRGWPLWGDDPGGCMGEMIADGESMARAMVEQRWPESTWTMTRPAHGWRNPGWVAQSLERRVLVKPVASTAPLVRLAHLGIAPPVLGEVVINGQAWMMQDWVDGHAPDRTWIRRHAAQVGERFGRVHADRELASLLGDDRQGTASDGFHADIARLHERLRQRHEAWFHTGEVRHALAVFFDGATALEPEQVVPTHDEPNTSNMLVEGSRLWLIDWDEMQLADPCRDCGPLVWWYLPEAEWPTLLTAAKVPPGSLTRRRIHWYAARISLSVALWHAEQGHESDHGFLGDFCAAAQGQANPRGQA